ncbi:hypothetical protein J6TS7_58120 [Paenibacillus dendritiformis]|nr:hypothetical protein [Paenibacillus dendritiformis]MEB9895323.1 hypothetical protein [Bacillus cereus]GIO82202.1 hypothetical protein J6TS7_58120 [Paenibacillus dendritiformis]
MLDKAKNSTLELPTNNDGKTPAPDTKPESTSKSEPSKPESKTKTEVVYISESQPESKPETKPESKPEPEPVPEPTLPTVTGVTYTTNVENLSSMGIAQVATLSITNDATAAGELRATFTDGMTPATVNVRLTGTETAADVAAEIAMRFGSSIKGWNVTSSGTNVLFTADTPAANNANVIATVEDIGTGVGTLRSTITTLGVEGSAGTAQVATLSISNGARAKASFYAEFTDGTRPVRVQIYLEGIETAEEVAAKIASAFGSSIPGWNVAATGSDVEFIAQTPADNNENVSIIIFVASGVGAPTSTITTPGDLNTNTAQVVSLKLPGSSTNAGPINVKFTDGVTSVTVNIMTSDKPGEGGMLADTVAAAFGCSIAGWDVAADGSNVQFTAQAPAANNEKVAVKVEELLTGVGTSSSTITTAGVPATEGGTKVATLTITNGAKVAGKLHVTFTDGSAPISVNVTLTELRSLLISAYITNDLPAIPIHDILHIYRI